MTIELIVQPIKNRNEATKEEYAKKRIDHFNKCGWKCVVIFDDELNDENYVVRRMI